MTEAAWHMMGWEMDKRGDYLFMGRCLTSAICQVIPHDATEPTAYRSGSRLNMQSCLDTRSGPSMSALSAQKDSSHPGPSHHLAPESLELGNLQPPCQVWAIPLN